MSKVAIVTGASRGIGRAVASQLAAEGWDLALQSTESSRRELVSLASELSRNGKAVPFTCDFSNDKSFGSEGAGFFLDSVLGVFGRVDALVNNAGVVSDVSVLDVDSAELQRVFAVNTFSPLLIARDVFKVMKENGGGRIVNISSFTVKYGMGRNCSVQYAASKAALESLTIGLSRMGAEHNVLVNAIRPGIVNTEQQQERSGLEARIQKVPLQRMAEPGEIAAGVSYFLSDSARFVTGQILTIAGGE